PMTAPLRRRGPRPLPLHLGLAGMRAAAATQSLGAVPGLAAMPWPNGLPNWNGAWPISKAGQAERARILGDLAAAGHPPEALAGAVLRRLARADRALIAGMAAYRRHPWRRELPDPPAIWAEGGTRLLDHGGEGPAVMFVPSLVNRAHVLDLTPEASLMRWLPGQGFRTLLLDWGWPGEAERHFTLTDYVAGRLERALMAAPGPVVLAGYCMGGLLALAAALRRPDRVRALALLATPWDFHAGPDGPRRART
ncbi:alpha/beta fold hydrolase, partial [Neoroseomonas rubea]|uniref:alpha/beta fold hydrolase n=1 Tax=Neoroseomonas rubea TaxID=2748666 RepID=UPI0038CD3996